jgi:hypothetical protein
MSADGGEARRMDVGQCDWGEVSLVELKLSRFDFLRLHLLGRFDDSENDDSSDNEAETEDGEKVVEHISCSGSWWRSGGRVESRVCLPRE